MEKKWILNTYWGEWVFGCFVFINLKEMILSCPRRWISELSINSSHPNPYTPRETKRFTMETTT